MYNLHDRTKAEEQKGKKLKDELHAVTSIKHSNSKYSPIISLIGVDAAPVSEFKQTRSSYERKGNLIVRQEIKNRVLWISYEYKIPG